MDVVILEVCRKELGLLPEEVFQDFLDAIGRLKEGENLNMPLSRPMPSLGKGVNELRLKDRSGIFRIIYVIKKGDAVYVVHAFKKKDQKTPQKNIDIVKKRIWRFQ